MDGERIRLSRVDSHPETGQYDPSTGDLSTKKVQNGEKPFKLLKYQDLPPHLKTNEYILTHYRSDWPFRHALGSLFSIHNETLNIWTHLVGFLIFLGLTAFTFVNLPKLMESSNFPNLGKFRTVSWRLSHLNSHLRPWAWHAQNVILPASLGFGSPWVWFALQALYVTVSTAVRVDAEDIHMEKVEENITDLIMPFSPTQSQITRWPFFVFLSGAMCCLLFSSTYHLLNCHSKRWHVILHRLDHAGIAILIAASFYPPVFYSFLCHPVLRNSYLFGITFLGSATILFSSLPMFRTPEFRPIRALLFSCMGISGVVPGVHKLLLFKEDPAAVSTVLYELGMGGFYGVGALLYATRIPERLKPGFFDIVGHSHQIFHILVVAGAYTHYLAGLTYLKWRDEVGCS